MQLSNEGLTTRRDNDRTTLKAGERSGSVIALVAEHPKRSRDVAARLADSVRRDVPRYLGGQTVSAAIGPWAPRADGLPRSYRIARGA